MGTWFDSFRGESQGRIAPRIITPTEGTKIFALGAEQIDVSAMLQDGDYTEVHQTLDLTGVDIVGATLDTLGVAMQQFEHPVGMEADAFTNILWTMDENYVGIANSVQPGANLAGQGDAEVSVETYSAVGSKCRKIPAGSTTGFFSGLMPPVSGAPASVPSYSFLWWMDFDADSHVTSDSINPIVFKAIDAGVGGVEIGLVGETGVGTPHQWWLYVKHVLGGSDETIIFTGHPITATTGWHMFAIVFDATQVGVNRLRLYVDGVLSTAGATAPTFYVGTPTSTLTAYLADPNLWGSIDQVKNTFPAYSASEVLAEYNACIAAQVINDAAWKMSVLVDDVVYCERTIIAAEARYWRDFYAPVRQLTGDHKVAFRLQLNEV